jgi:hypothetical protein
MLALMADKGRDKQNTSLAGESVADYAKREMEEVKERERRKEAYWRNQKRVAIELPARFLKLVDVIRAEVDTFNSIVDVGRRLSFSESLALAARAEVGKAELNLTFGRKGVEAWVGLSELMRLGRGPTAYIIEAFVKFSKAPQLRLRAEAIPKGDEDVRYRVTTDGKETRFGIDELGSRLVLAVTKDDPTLLDGPPAPV